MIDSHDLDSFRHFKDHPEELPRTSDPRNYPPDSLEPPGKLRILNRVISVFAAIVVAIFLTMTARGVGIGKDPVYQEAISWVLVIAIAGLLISLILLIVTPLHTSGRE
jgi:hypothetical protein